MIKIQKHIEIVRSSNPRLSSLSLVSCMAIYNVLKRHYAKVGITTVDYASDLEQIVNKKPDLVFIGLNYVPRDSETNECAPAKIWVSDFLDQHEIAYTGSTKPARELEVNKALAKQRALDTGLSTPAFYITSENQVGDAKTLRYPVFVKPASRGGGVGIDSDSVAHTAEDLFSKVRSIRSKLQSDSLVEEYLPGREFSVAILKDEHSNDYFVMPLELIAPADINGDRILSASVKSADSEIYEDVHDTHIKSKVSTLALDIFWALGARDYGRIDIRLDSNEVPHFLEANLIPSLIDNYGTFPKACALNIGMNYEEMILSIASLGLNRSSVKYDEIPAVNLATYGQVAVV